MGTVPDMQMYPRMLSVDQPFAWLMCEGIKNIESRSWRDGTLFTGPVLIHANRRFDVAGAMWCQRQGIYYPKDLPTGVIVGRANLETCVSDHFAQMLIPPDYRGWMRDDPRSYHLVFTDAVHAPAPVPAYSAGNNMLPAPAGWKAAFEPSLAHTNAPGLP